MKICLVGYFGYENLGDEAILQAVLSQLKSLPKPVQILVLSGDPERTSETYHVQTLHHKKIPNLVAACQWADLFVFCGGTLFQDHTSFFNLLYYSSLVFLGRMLGCKVLCVSQGVEPLKWPWSRWLLKQAFVFTHHFSVRDQRSLLYLTQELKVKKRVFFATDAAFELAPYIKSNIRKRTMGLSLIPMPFLPLESVISDLKEFIDQTGYSILYFSFSPHDRVIGERLAAQFSKEQFDLYPVKSPAETLGAISQLEFMVGARLHSLIFAAVVDVPFLGVQYYDKVKSFCLEVGQSVIDVAALKKSRLKDALHLLETEQSAKKALLITKVKALRDRGRDQVLGNVLVKFDR